MRVAGRYAETTPLLPRGAINNNLDGSPNSRGAEVERRWAALAGISSLWVLVIVWLTAGLLFYRFQVGWSWAQATYFVIQS